jgi:copper homeostasis protein
LEIAVSTPDEAERAVANGADRLELSSGLEVGGLTPSVGLVRAVRERVNVPLYVLLRPRSGGFAYTDRAFAVMQMDAKVLLAEGVSGIVFGVLTPEGAIDADRCRALVDLANGRAVFHRAFDFLTDPIAALEELIALGFERVLTSGGAATAEAGAERLAELVRRAGGRMEVLPAGSIRPHNVDALVRMTGCAQVHAAVRVPVEDPLLAARPQLAAGMGVPGELAAGLVKGLREQLDRVAGVLS